MLPFDMDPYTQGNLGEEMADGAQVCFSRVRHLVCVTAQSSFSDMERLLGGGGRARQGPHGFLESHRRCHSSFRQSPHQSAATTCDSWLCDTHVNPRLPCSPVFLWRSYLNRPSYSVPTLSSPLTRCSLISWKLSARKTRKTTLRPLTTLLRICPFAR
jgi:hypothetical protein